MSSHIATKSKGEDLDRDPNLDPLWCCRRGIRACAPRHSRRQSHESSIVRLLCARAYTRSTCIAHRETCMDRRGKKGTKSLANLSQGSSSSALALPCFQVPVACMSQRTHTAKLPAKGGRKDVVGRPGWRQSKAMIMGLLDQRLWAFEFQSRFQSASDAIAATCRSLFTGQNACVPERVLLLINLSLKYVIFFLHQVSKFYSVYSFKLHRSKFLVYKLKKKKSSSLRVTKIQI